MSQWGSMPNPRPGSIPNAGGGLMGSTPKTGLAVITLTTATGALKSATDGAQATPLPGTQAMTKITRPNIASMTTDFTSQRHRSVTYFFTYCTESRPQPLDVVLFLCVLVVTVWAMVRALA